MEFETRYRSPVRVHSNLGSPIKQLYTPVFDHDGNLNLVESGQEDLYAEIQSHKDSVDIHVLLQRYANGDSTALTRAQGSYGDFTEMPKTYAELLNNLIQGEKQFLELPVDVRAKFDHSFQNWLITAGSEEWCKAMGMDVASAASNASVSPSIESTAPTATPEGVENK